MPGAIVSAYYRIFQALSLVHPLKIRLKDPYGYKSWIVPVYVLHDTLEVVR